MNKIECFPQIETERCKLDNVNDCDLDDILELFSDDDVIRFVEASNLYNSDVASTKEFVSLFRGAFLSSKAFLWGIKLKYGYKQLVGLIAIYDVELNDSASIFYALKPSCRGKGIMVECLRNVGLFCFDSLSLKQVSLKIQKENSSSISLAKKCGYKEFECYDNDKIFLLNV